MKQILSLFLFIVISYTSSAQQQKKPVQDTILWKKNALLKTSDFQAKKSSTNSPAYAYTSIFLYPSEDNGNTILHIDAIFLKSQSFMKIKTADAVSHEQLHFDLAELFARKLRKRISEIDYGKVSDISAEIKILYDKTIAEWNTESTNYDKDVQHGMNAAQQKVWGVKISAQLREMEEFINNTITLQ